MVAISSSLSKCHHAGGRGPFRRFGVAGQGLLGVGLAVLLAGVWLFGRAALADPVAAGDRAVAQALATLETQFRETPPVLAEGMLRVGWGRRCITPTKPLALFGYGDRKGARSTGVADDLSVGAVALDNGAVRLVILSADLLVVPDTLGETVREALGQGAGLHPSAVLLSGTHTHAAPNPWNSAVAGMFAGGSHDPGYGRLLAEACIAAAQEALANLSPGALALTHFNAGQHTANRARKDNPYDATVEILVLRRAGDGATALLVNIPAHATVLSAGNLLVSADWPGWLRRHLEAEFAAFALVQAGAVGSVRPQAPEPMAEDYAAVQAAATAWGVAVDDGMAPESRPPAWRDAARACALARVLSGEIVTTATATTMASKVLLGHASAVCALPPAAVVLGGNLPLPPLAVAALGIGPNTTFQALRIADAVLVGIGGELSGELALPLKQAAAQRGRRLWISSFSFDYKGYISPDEYYRATGSSGMARYETDAMAWFGPRAGDYFRQLTAAIAAAMEPPAGE